MPERADAADTLGHVDELVVIARLPSFQAAVDAKPICGTASVISISPRDRGAKAQAAPDVGERDDGRLSHATHLPFLFPSSPLRARRPASKRPSRWLLSGSRFAIFSSAAACFAAASFLAFAAMAALTRATFSGIHAGQARPGRRSRRLDDVACRRTSRRDGSPRTRPPPGTSQRARAAFASATFLAFASRLLLRRDDGHGLFLREARRSCRRSR